MNSCVFLYGLHLSSLVWENLINADDSSRDMASSGMRRLMGNGVIIIPPHNFVRPWRRIYQLYETEKYDSGLASNGMTSMKNFMRIHSAILELLHAYRQSSPEMTFIEADDVIKEDDVTSNAQNIMGNVLIDPPHDIEHSSRWYYQLWENESTIIN
jgi:hypothetical protein